MAHRVNALRDEEEELGRMRRRPTWFTDIARELSLNVNEAKLAELDEHKMLVASNLNAWLSSREMQGRWNLSLEKLTQIPSVVWAFVDETVALLLQDNLLSSVPIQISELCNLRRIDLSGNEIQHLPNTFAQLKLLEDLFLDRNHLDSIPAPILKLPNLQWLDLQDNNITSIPIALAEMTTLRILDLSDNRITRIPPEIGELSGLSTLNLSGNPQPSFSLPENLYSITTLRNLYLRAMNLKEISGLIGKLSRLEKLDLSHNKLTKLPDGIAKLDRLRWVSVSHNCLQSLPLGLGWLASLNYFQVDGRGNTLENVPVDMRGSALDIQIALRRQMRERSEHQMRFFTEPDNHMNIITKTAKVDDDLREVIVGCSPEKLVERMTLPGELDSSLVTAVLLTYSCFLSAHQFLDLLLMRFNYANEDETELDATRARGNKIIRLRVFNLIKKWVETHVDDFEGEIGRRLHQFLNFISKNNPATEQAVIQIVSLENRLKQERLNPPTLAFDEPPPKPIVPPDLSTKYMLIDIHPKELARQLTLLEYRMLQSIGTRECLLQGWSKKAKNHLAPNIMKFIAHFNHVQKSVTSAIVRVADRKRRVETIHRFIEMADELIELKNFTGASEVYSGLQSTSVHRLKQTWTQISVKHQEILTRLRTLWASDGNNRNYREALKRASSPVILHLGTFLKDLTFLLDGNPDKLKQNCDLVNVQKFTMIASTINTLLNARKKPYCLQQVPFIQELIENTETLSEEESYQESLLCEPKPGDNVSARARELRLLRERQMLERNSNRAELLNPEREQRVEEVHRTLTSALESMGIEVDGVHRKDAILFLRRDGEWSRFYFLLMHPALYFYQEKGDMTPIGVINLAGTVIRGVGTKESFIFIYHPERRTFAIRGEVDTETKSWLQCLQAVVGTGASMRMRPAH